MNKSDLGDEARMKHGRNIFRERDFCGEGGFRSGSGMKMIQNVIQEACKEKTERDRRRGIKNRPIRAMVVGIPQRWQVHFLLILCWKSLRQNRQQARCNQGQAVDSPEQECGASGYPGILWPKFEDQEVGMRLAYIGSIKDDILNIEELALWLIEKRKKYPGDS